MAIRNITQNFQQNNSLWVAFTWVRKKFTWPVFWLDNQRTVNFRLWPTVHKIPSWWEITRQHATSRLSIKSPVTDPCHSNLNVGLRPSFIVSLPPPTTFKVIYVTIFVAHIWKRQAYVRARIYPTILSSLLHFLVLYPGRKKKSSSQWDTIGFFFLLKRCGAHSLEPWVNTILKCAFSFCVCVLSSILSFLLFYIISHCLRGWKK